MVYNTRDYWVFGLRPPPGIRNNTKEHSVSKTDLFPSSGGGVGDTYSVGSVFFFSGVGLTSPDTAATSGLL
jgi:hypothetical protein